MTDVTFPSGVYWTNFGYEMVRASFGMASPYTGRTQILQSPYAVWMVEGGLIPYEKTDVGPIKSWLMKMSGKANRTKLLLPDADRNALGTTQLGTVKTTASSGSTSITAQGYTPSTALAQEGDYVNIGDELKVITSVYTSNGSGEETFTFAPPLRNEQTAGTVVRLHDNFLWVRAAEDNIATWSITAPVEHAIELKFVEDVD